MRPLDTSSINSAPHCRPLILLCYCRDMSSPACIPTRGRSFSIPLFLTPAFAESTHTVRTSSRQSFSTSQHMASRRTTGRNKQRGVSAIRSIPPKQKSEVYRYDLPRPVIDPDRRALFPTPKDHGLWGFFNKKREALASGPVEAAHGRSWTYQELTAKSFEDLHRLYWTCILESNQIRTRLREMQRTRAGFGAHEAKGRLTTVRRLHSCHTSL